MNSPGPYTYVLSLPERVVRSLGALCGGLLRELGNVALPVSVRKTALYRTMVDVTLQFLIEEVGQVEGVYPSENGIARNFLLRRTASHGIELLGLLTFHASPVWVLAALADATGAGRALIQEISEALKEQGLLERESRFETVDQILDGLEKTTAHLAQTLNMPPLDVAGLRKEWRTLRAEIGEVPAARLPRLERLERIWLRLKQSAHDQDRSIFMVSSLMAVSAIARVPADVLRLSRAGRSTARRTGKLFGGPVLDHYAAALDEISRSGIVEFWSREFRPYLRAAAEQFAPAHESATERMLRRRTRP